MSHLNLQVSAKNFELTPAIQAYVHQRMQPLIRHFHHLSTPLNVVLSVDNFRHEAKFHCHLPGGKDVNATASSKDMYETIDQLAKIVDQQAKKHHDEMKQRDRHDDELL